MSNTETVSLTESQLPPLPFSTATSIAPSVLSNHKSRQQYASSVHSTSSDIRKQPEMFSTTPEIHIDEHLDNSTPSTPLVGPTDLIHPWLSNRLIYRLSTSRKSPDELKRLKAQGISSKVTQFYEDQNELIDDLLTPLVEHDVDQQNLDDRRVTLAVQLSLMVNIILFGCQITAATSSASLALIATATDSFMDLLSGVVLLFADRAAKRQNVLDYPTGKRRFETIGVIVFSCLMSALSGQLIVEAIRDLTGGKGVPPSTDLMEIILICVALVSKLCLFFYCNTMRKYTLAKTLATDHRNDLFLNSFGLSMSLLSVRLEWWLDPLGGLLIGLMILRSWATTAWENVQLLIGKSAPPAMLNKITYIAATHHAKILQVDTCRAYWLGAKMFVEVDIVLPPDMTLRESHDIGESLQIKLESLPNVERAFVHVDYEFDHRPEHRLK